MGERTQGRSNNIMLSAQQLDHNASKARSLNKRAGNRLRLHKGSIDGHQTAHMHSLNYEMRRLQHELKEITQTSGTLEVNETITERTMPAKAGAGDTARKKKSKRGTSVKYSNNDNGSATATNVLTAETLAKPNSDPSRRKSLSLPTLPSMTSTLPQLSSRTDISRVQEDTVEQSFPKRKSSKPKEMRRKQSRRKLSVDASSAGLNFGHSADRFPVNVSVTNTNGETERFRPVSRGASKLDSSLVNVNLDAVKDRIQNRLSQPAATNQLHDNDNDDDDDDITPYLHVPPDGLPRTVYLLPPLSELLQEAKKARYIRRPKKPLDEVDLDDPERELGIDEIFSKKR